MTKVSEMTTVTLQAAQTLRWKSWEEKHWDDLRQ